MPPASGATIDDKHFVKHLPESLQLRILSMVAGVPPAATGCAQQTTPGSVVRHTDRSRASSAAVGTDETAMSAWVHGLTARLLAHGFSWQDEMVSEDAAIALLRAATAMPTSAFAPAGMSTSVVKWRDASVRGDEIAWVPLEATEGSAFASLHAASGWSELRRALACIVDAFNDEAAAQGSDEVIQLPSKVMLARYPQGGRYVRHSDVSPAVSHRRLTAILYLNEGWQPADGGELVLYPPEQGTALPIQRIAPRLGRLLLFRSATEHEVVETRAPRLAVTAWLSVAKAAAPAVSGSSMAMVELARAMAAKATTAASNVPPSSLPHESSLVTPLPVAPPVAPLATAQVSETVPATTAGGDARGASLGRSAAQSIQSMQATDEQAEDIDAQPQPTIFVSVASYRDPEAPHTLRSLFESAAVPSRVVVGVCFQCAEDSEDGECTDLSGLRPEWRANVRTLRMPWREARGPVWARFLIQRELLADEDYFLQIDSHTRFVPGWDRALVAMLQRCASPKPVLSTYPLPYSGEGSAATLSDEPRQTILCTRPATGAFGADGMLRFRARLLAAPPAAPLPSAFWAAGFSFSSAALAREVPYDPHLPFLFFGEEISMVLRMWTRGWDLFAPDAHLLYHKWERGHRKGTFWEVEGGAELKRASQARVRRLVTGERLVGLDKAPPRTNTPADDASADDAHTGAVDGALAGVPAASDPVWGLGTVRSLRLYEALAGVDFRSKTVAQQAERGGLRSEACFWDRFADLHAMLESSAAAEGGVAVDEAAQPE